MSNQPEALRLSDALQESHPYPLDIRQAAAELRRLHTSCEDYMQHKQRQDQRVLELAERVLELKAQRDALLEALQKIEPILARMYGPKAAELLPMQMVRAAIKAVEGEKS